MKRQRVNLWQSFLKVSLWIASIGLMVASSGLDGAYLAKLMPDGWAWLGLVLNTMTDITSELGMYWYGRLQQDIKAKRKRAKWILVGEVLLTGYAWLFSWRQLVPIIAKVDPTAPWMAWVGALFIPLALVVAGYIQSLLAGRIEVEKVDAPMVEVGAKQEPVVSQDDRLVALAAKFGVTLTAKQARALSGMVPVDVDERWVVAHAGELRAALADLDNPAPVTPKLTPKLRRERVLDAMLAPDPPSQAQLAEQFGVGRSTIGNDVSTLRKAGKLNGHREATT